MTMKLRLDTDGLRALIKDNPELEVAIGKEVLNNIKDDFLTSKVLDRIEACLKGMVQSSGGWNPTYTAKAPELRQAIQAAVSGIIKEQLDQTIASVVSSRVGDVMRSERELIVRDVKALLRELVTPEMAREIMREKIL